MVGEVSDIDISFFLWQRWWKLTLQVKSVHFFNLPLLRTALGTCFWFVRGKTQILEIHMRWEGKEDGGLMSSNNLRMTFILVLRTLTRNTHICCSFDHNCIRGHFFLSAHAKKLKYTQWRRKRGWWDRCSIAGKKFPQALWVLLTFFSFQL